MFSTIRRHLCFYVIIPFIFGCTKFKAAVEGSSSQKSEVDQVCEPGTVASDMKSSLSVPNGRCMPTCKSDGSGYECASPEFIVCNPGFSLSSDRSLSCVKPPSGSTSGGSTTGGSSGGSTSGGSTAGITSGGSSTGGTSGGSTTGSTSGGTSGGSTSGSTTGGSTSGGSTSGGTTTGGSTTGSTTSGTTTSSSGPKFFIDAKVYNPESSVEWTEFAEGVAPSIYLGKIRSGEVAPPEVRLRVVGETALTQCGGTNILGVTLTPTVSGSEIIFKFKLDGTSPRMVNADYNLCVRAGNKNLTTVVKITGEVQ